MPKVWWYRGQNLVPSPPFYPPLLLNRHLEREKMPKQSYLWSPMMPNSESIDAKMQKNCKKNKDQRFQSHSGLIWCLLLDLKMPKWHHKRSQGDIWDILWCFILELMMRKWCQIWPFNNSTSNILKYKRDIKRNCYS